MLANTVNSLRPGSEDYQIPGRTCQRNLWWIDEKWLWSCPAWIMELSIDKDLFVSFCHATESLSLPETADRRWWSKRKEGRRAPSRHCSLRKTTYLKGRLLSLSLCLPVKNENYKEDNNKNSKMSGQAEASPLLKAALGFVVKMCCLLQKHASPPAQNKWAVPDIFTSNCSSVCGESCSLSRQPRPVHLRDRLRGLSRDKWKKTALGGQPRGREIWKKWK